MELDIRNRPDAYDENIFMRDGQTKVKIKESDKKTTVPVIINSIWLLKKISHARIKSN